MPRPSQACRSATSVVHGLAGGSSPHHGRRPAWRPYLGLRAFWMYAWDDHLCEIQSIDVHEVILIRIFGVSVINLKSCVSLASLFSIWVVKSRNGPEGYGGICAQVSHG